MIFIYPAVFRKEGDGRYHAFSRIWNVVKLPVIPWMMPLTMPMTLPRPGSA